MRITSIHYLHPQSELKAIQRAEALSRRKAVWLKFGAAAAKAVAAKGLALVKSLGSEGAIGGYCAIRSELDPLPLLEALHAGGYGLALPCMREGRGLAFRRWQPGSALERRNFGVLEPGAGEPLSDPGVFFVPLAAFDAKGNRLGYGAGYYDGFLREMRARRRILAIGVAFDEQEASEIPREPQDEPLDMILTPSRVLTCEG